VLAPYNSSVASAVTNFGLLWPIAGSISTHACGVDGSCHVDGVSEVVAESVGGESKILTDFSWSIEVDDACVRGAFIESKSTEWSGIA
jgi:hypothetical protein